MPEFVIQLHDHPDGAHWDLMLEKADHLATWQIPIPLTQWSAHPVACTRIFDHRKKYLTYEGPLTQNRGSVHIADKGEYRVLSQSDTVFHLQINGSRLNGRLILTQKLEMQWTLVYQPESGGETPEPPKR